MSRESKSRPCFEIRLRPEPHCADSIRALRQLLKVALRRWGLRAVAVKEVQPREAERR
jgi:hypothetical protein